MRIEDFDYFLPKTMIAQDPLEPRDNSRLLIMDRSDGEIRHSIFNQIGKELRLSDILIINDTKVLPARIYANKESGATIEVLLLKEIEKNFWQCLVRPGKKALIGTKLNFSQPILTARVEDISEGGTRLIRFFPERDFLNVIDHLGIMPLPPYIKKPLFNQNRYQTVYARERGSAAAPTAGLHFTPQLLNEIQNQGVHIIKILLHVGLDTFRPVKAKNVEGHRMHSEFYRVTAEAAQAINAAKAKGGRVIAVGTTVVRTLETVANDQGYLCAAEGWTRKYIYPGYQFKIIDGMITNFHLPKSTLVMLVSAFAGREHLLNAYKVAIRENYRFYSFGDAMLII